MTALKTLFWWFSDILAVASAFDPDGCFLSRGLGSME
jgi:hypothetical protein